MFPSSSQAIGTAFRTVIAAVTPLPVSNLVPLQDVAVVQGQTATFSAQASGFPLYFQWLKNGVPIAGATSSEYTIPHVGPARAGAYSVIVSNPTGSVTSTPPATLTVDPPFGSVVMLGNSEEAQGQVPESARIGVKAIASGNSHRVALLQDGSVVAWGDNSVGQASPPASLRTNIAAISAGDFYTVVLKRDGSVGGWGDGSSKQLEFPLSVSSGVVAISAGARHVLAVRTNGSVVAWGDPTGGKLLVPSGAMDGVIAVSAGSVHSLALKSDGTVLSWGTNGFAQTNVPASARAGVKSVVAGDRYSAAIIQDGSVVVWGDLSWLPSPIPADGLFDVVAVSARGREALALKRDGTVVSWGSPFLPNFLTQPEVQGHISAIASGGNDAMALLGTPSNLVATPTDTGLTLNWLTNSAGLISQSSPALGSGESWTDLGPTPDPIRSIHRVTIPVSSSSHRWYRLRGP